MQGVSCRSFAHSCSGARWDNHPHVRKSGTDARLEVRRFRKSTDENEGFAPIDGLNLGVDEVQDFCDYWLEDFDEFLVRYDKLVCV